MNTVFSGGLGAIAALGWVWGHRRAAAGARRWLAPLLFFDSLVVVLVALALVWPRQFSHAMQEDGWVEWGTFFAFAMAAWAGAQAGHRARLDKDGPRNLWTTAGLYAVALFCLFVASEEISWGQRLLAFAPPEIFLEHNFQQELNVHNFLKGKEAGGIKLDSRFLIAIISVGYGVVAPVLASRLGNHRFGEFVRGVAPSPFLLPWFAGIAGVELAYPVDLAGEACELLLGMVFLQGNLDKRGAYGGASLGTRGALIWLGAPLVLGAAVGPVVQVVVYGPDEALVAQTSAELEQLGADLGREGVIGRKLKKRRTVHKRLFTAIRDGYLDFGTDSTFLAGQWTPAQSSSEIPRRDRRGYLLDPWNNPYWIHFSRKRGSILLYSFGPNRRRDTGFKSKRSVRTSMGGDDIGLEVEL